MISKNRWGGFVLYIVGSILFWYAAILMSQSSEGVPKPTTTQLIGVIIAVVLSIFAWGQDVFTIKPVSSNGSSGPPVSIFSKNRWLALGIGVFIVGFQWYQTILFTERTDEFPKPGKVQWIGLGIGFAILIFTWLQQILTFKGKPTSKGKPTGGKQTSTVSKPRFSFSTLKTIPTLE